MKLQSKIMYIMFICILKKVHIKQRGEKFMLNIYFGAMPEAIFKTSVYFDNTFDESWFEDDFANEKGMTDTLTGGL